MNGPDQRDPVETPAQTRERIANNKLRLAMATRDPMRAAKATGVHFVSGPEGRKQAQMIFDDGSIRNPYKTDRTLSGRQKRKMAKAANRSMRRTEPGAMDIRDYFKGRQQEAPASQEVTATGPEMLPGELPPDTPIERMGE